MRIITFANNKGGVGKTTSALSVAYRLAELGHRTLIIDADPQGNTTTSLPEADGGGSLAQALKGTPLADCTYPAKDNLSSVPAGKKELAREEKSFGGDAEYVWFFRNELKSLREGEGSDIDYVIIDTGPNMGPLTMSALIASDFVFIPTLPNLYASEGVAALMERLVIIRKNFNPKLQLGGIFFTKYAPTYRKQLHKKYAQEMQDDPELGRHIMGVTIRDNVALDEAPSSHQSVYDWAPTSNGALDYRTLTDEIIRRTR